MLQRYKIFPETPNNSPQKLSGLAFRAGDIVPESANYGSERHRFERRIKVQQLNFSFFINLIFKIV